jgi:hypothetical protein
MSAISQTRKEKIDFLNKDFLDKKAINDSLLNLIESLKKENAILSESKASPEKNDPLKEETKKSSSVGTKSTKKKKAITPSRVKKNNKTNAILCSKKFPFFCISMFGCSD